MTDDGETFTFQWDKLNRLTQEQSSSWTETYIYNERDLKLNESYNGGGHTTDISYIYSYDGKLLSEYNIWGHAKNVKRLTNLQYESACSFSAP
jgi:hypothetical protein